MTFRTLVTAALLVLPLSAMAGKKDKNEPVPAPAPAPAPSVEPAAPPPAPEPVAEAPPANNADIRVDMTFADGTKKAGHVVRIERATDWYGETGWETSGAKTTLTLEGDGTEVEKPWSEMKEVTVAYGTKDSIDCFFESNFDPPMYTCTLKTTAAAKDKAGKSFAVTTRNKWRFTFDDGSSVEFFVSKLPNRLPDDQQVDLKSANTENQALYQRLQDEVLVTAKKSVTKITIQ